jgi:hypothetical protein
LEAIGSAAYLRYDRTAHGTDAIAEHTTPLKAITVALSGMDDDQLSTGVAALHDRYTRTTELVRRMGLTP